MGQVLKHMSMVVNQSMPPKPTWGIDDIPNLSGKIVIVTGGNTGIGRETVKALLTKNATVYLAARNKQKSETTIQELKEATGKEAKFLELDLSELKKVKQSAEEFLSKEKELHILFNNAGVMIPPIEQLTADGYDLQFGTNVLGHFYFTKLLLPVLTSTAESSPERSVRVVTTSSSGHIFWGSNIRYDTLRDSPERKKLGTQMLYCQSKSGNILFARELARRYADKSIVSTSLNPGNIKSDLQRHTSKIQELLIAPMLYPTPMGALTQLYAGTAPEAREMNGKYFIPWARVGEARRESLDSKAAEQLWDWLEDQVKNV